MFLNNVYIDYIKQMGWLRREGGWLISLKYLLSPNYWKARQILNDDDPLDRAILESIKHDDLLINVIPLS